MLAEPNGRPQVSTLAPSRPAAKAPVAKPERDTTTGTKRKHKVAAVAPIAALQDTPADLPFLTPAPGTPGAP